MRMQSRMVLLGCAAILLLGSGGCASTGPKGLSRQQVLLAVGERAEMAGDLDAALVEYVRALGLDEPDAATSAEAHFRVGRVHTALGNSATAREAYRRALAGAPEHPGALEGLGLMALEAGERPVANALLHQALARDAGLWRSYNGLGVLADLDGKHELAQGFFGEALKARPDEVSVLNNLGYSFYLDGKPELARQQYEQALRRDPRNEKAWSNLALVHTRQQHYGEAVLTLERIMDPPEARYSIGTLCLLEGRLPEARRLLEDSIRVSNRYEPRAQAALKRVREAELRRARAGDEAD